MSGSGSTEENQTLFVKQMVAFRLRFQFFISQLFLNPEWLQITVSSSMVIDKV